MRKSFVFIAIVLCFALTFAQEDATVTQPDNATMMANATEEANAVPENATAAPENASVVVENATVLPENATAATENATAAPENVTVVVENATVIPENATAGAENATVLPENATMAENATEVMPNATESVPLENATDMNATPIEENATAIEANATESNVTAASLEGMPQCTITPRTSAADTVADEDFQALRDGDLKFALDLLAKLNPDGNFFFSPLAIYTSLSMLFAGAGGDTAKQISDVLYFKLGEPQLANAFSQLWNILRTMPDGSDVNFTLVDTIWIEQGVTIDDNYRSLLNDDYETCVRQVDFKTNFNQINSWINNWVDQESNGEIFDILPGGLIDDKTMLALVNSLFFRGAWDRPFDKTMTADGTFKKVDGTQVTVSMITSAGEDYDRTSGDGYQAIRLNYKGLQYSLTLIVPDEGQFENVQSRLIIDDYKSLFTFKNTTSLKVSLPKFSVRTHLPLADVLKQLGINDAFDSTKADFSGIDGAKDLFLQQVIHGARIIIDEDGTGIGNHAAEAAPAAASFLGTAPEDFIIDRPFIILIHDNLGTLLHMGQIHDPSIME